MANYIAGPWEVGAVGTDYTDVYSAAGEYLVAEAYGRTTDQVAANARLIAAAPELLEALQWLAMFWEEHIGSPHLKAEAAISKALGQQAPA